MVENILLEMKVSDIAGTQQFAEKAVLLFNPGDTILLYGTLGSGKTFLTNIFVRLLGFEIGATSPSFSIINQYEGKVFVNHLDFYRIQDRQELYNLGLDDIFNMESINFIEWPQIIENKIYWDHFRIYIEMDEKHYTKRVFKLIRYYTLRGETAAN